MTVTRTASIDRKTGETDVSLSLGLSGVIAAYGPIHFWGTQIARIAGCTLGGFSAKGA